MADGDAQSGASRAHPVCEDGSLRQAVETVELFQSPPRGERGYRVLASMLLRAAPAGSADRSPRANG